MKGKISLSFSLVLLVFFIIVLSVLSAGGIAYLLIRFGFMDLDGTASPQREIFVLIYVSMFVGLTITTLLSRRSVKPIRDMMEATQKVAQGDFSVTVKGSFVFELDALAGSFNKMVKELRGIETLRSDFVRNFSHEFKTPITSIRGFAKILQAGDITEEERQEYLHIIVEEAERLVHLSTNVLNLSKIESKEIISDKTRYCLDEQIRLAVVMMESKWCEKNLNVEVELEDGVEILGEKNLIQQIWVNLLDNAIKYTNREGTIKVQLQKKGSEAVFCIKDTGCGMDAETMQHIFDKFYQGDTSHTTVGNGLGLTLVKRITELCEGSIEVQSEPGQGSLFTVRLPL